MDHERDGRYGGCLRTSKARSKSSVAVFEHLGTGCSEWRPVETHDSTRLRP